MATENGTDDHSFDESDQKPAGRILTGMAHSSKKHIRSPTTSARKDETDDLEPVDEEMPSDSGDKNMNSTEYNENSGKEQRHRQPRQLLRIERRDQKDGLTRLELRYVSYQKSDKSEMSDAEVASRILADMFARYKSLKSQQAKNDYMDRQDDGVRKLISLMNDVDNKLTDRK